MMTLEALTNTVVVARAESKNAASEPQIPVADPLQELLGIPLSEAETQDFLGWATMSGRDRLTRVERDLNDTTLPGTQTGRELGQALYHALLQSKPFTVPDALQVKLPPGLRQMIWLDERGDVSHASLAEALRQRVHRLSGTTQVSEQSAALGRELQVDKDEAVVMLAACYELAQNNFLAYKDASPAADSLPVITTLWHGMDGFRLTRAAPISTGVPTWFDKNFLSYFDPKNVVVAEMLLDLEKVLSDQMKADFKPVFQVARTTYEDNMKEIVKECIQKLEKGIQDKAHEHNQSAFSQAKEDAFWFVKSRDVSFYANPVEPSDTEVTSPMMIHLSMFLGEKTPEGQEARQRVLQTPDGATRRGAVGHLDALEVILHDSQIRREVVNRATGPNGKLSFLQNNSGIQEFCKLKKIDMPAFVSGLADQQLGTEAIGQAWGILKQVLKQPNGKDSDRIAVAVRALQVIAPGTAMAHLMKGSATTMAEGLVRDDFLLTLQTLQGSEDKAYRNRLLALPVRAREADALPPASAS